MPPRVPTATKKRIKTLAEEGFSQVEIARELSIDRRTVAHYVDRVVPPTTTASAAPALSRELLGKLQFLAKSVESGTCPACGATMYYLGDSQSLTCPGCNGRWSVRREPSSALPSTVRPSQTTRHAASGQAGQTSLRAV